MMQSILNIYDRTTTEWLSIIDGIAYKYCLTLELVTNEECYMLYRLLNKKSDWDCIIEITDVMLKFVISTDRVTIPRSKDLEKRGIVLIGAKDEPKKARASFLLYDKIEEQKDKNPQLLWAARQKLCENQLKKLCNDLGLELTPQETRKIAYTSGEFKKEEPFLEEALRISNCFNKFKIRFPCVEYRSDDIELQLSPKIQAKFVAEIEILQNNLSQKRLFLKYVPWELIRIARSGDNKGHLKLLPEYLHKYLTRDSALGCDANAEITKKLKDMSNIRSIFKNKLPQFIESYYIPFYSFKEEKLVKQIGQGGYCKIFKMTYKDSPVVIKALSSQRRSDAAALLKECYLLKSLEHVEGVVKCLGFTVIEEWPALVLEYCSGGSLSHLIKNRQRARRLTWADSLDISIKVAETLEKLHKAKIVHYDIKPANVLFRKNGNDYEPVLCDFGLSKPANCRSDGFTATYCPLEQMKQGMTGTHSDIWAFAMTLYAIFAQRSPFSCLRLPRSSSNVGSKKSAMFSQSNSTDDCLDQCQQTISYSAMRGRTTMRKITKQQMIKVLNDEKNVENLSKKSLFNAIVTDIGRKTSGDFDSTKANGIRKILKSCWKYTVVERTSISQVLKKLEALRN